MAGIPAALRTLIMKEYAEFRIRENYAREFLPNDMGKCLMDLVRLSKITSYSDEYRKIGDITRLVRKRDNKYLFFGWSIQRIYSKEELLSAKLLLLKLTKTFEPAGEECGTIYDYKDICEICGSGSVGF